MCSIEIIFVALDRHALHEAQIATYYSSSLHGRPYVKQNSTVKSLRAQLASRGSYCAFCALGERTPPTYTVKFGASLWYLL